METRLYACASRIFARSRARVGEAATQEVFGSWLIARDTESGGTSKTLAVEIRAPTGRVLHALSQRVFLSLSFFLSVSRCLGVPRLFLASPSRDSSKI